MEIEAMGFKGAPVIMADDPRPISLYTKIRVDARTHIGELVVSQCEPSGSGCQWGASIIYCVHVTQEAGKRVIVVEKHNAMIGARTLRSRDGA